MIKITDVDKKNGCLVAYIGSYSPHKKKIFRVMSLAPF